jgi:hypothetical protein
MDTVRDVEIVASRMKKSADVIADGKCVGSDPASEDEIYASLRPIRDDDGIPDIEVESLYHISRARPRFKLAFREAEKANEEASEPGDLPRDSTDG